MLPKSLLASTAMLALLATPAFAQSTMPTAAAPKASTPNAQTKHISASAQTFVTMAANGGMFEVQSSKLALDKSKRSDVKQFAQKMIDDHTKAGNELKTVSSKLGATVPDKLDAAHQSKFDKLSGAKDTAFDAAYLSSQMDAHREAVTLFSNYSKTGDNTDLKSFASTTLPVLQGHEKDLKALDKSAAVGGSTGASGKSK